MATSSAAAVEYAGIGLRPAQPIANNPRSQSIFVYTLKPGQSQADSVRLINNTSDSHTVQLYTVDSVASSDGAFACAQAVENKKDVGSWITLSQDKVILGPFSNQTVPFTITLPNQTDAGEHDGCVVMQDAAPSKEKTAAGITLSFRSAVRVAVTVPGKLVVKLQLDSVSQKSADQNSYTVTPSYTNGGNVSLDTSIEASFINVLGHTSAHGGGQFPVLPHTTSRFNLVVKKPFWGGLYRRQVATTYKMLSSNGESQQEKKALPTTSAWVVIPPQTGAAFIEVLVLAIIATAVIFFVIRRRKHRLLLLASQEYTVKKGDNLQSLAKKYNISWKTLVKINHLRPPYVLTVGERIKVPSSQEQHSTEANK